MSEEILSGDVDAYFSSIVEQIQTGQHPELRRRNVPLERMKEKHIAACDRHRKEQIKNINQMYEYEIEDAKAQHQVRIISIHGRNKITKCKYVTASVFRPTRTTNCGRHG